MKALTTSTRIFPLALLALLGLVAIAAPQAAHARRGAWRTTSTSTSTTTSTSTLTISGTPVTTDTAGAAYGFTPTVSASSSTYSFSISNKPSWATFSIATGALSGTPGTANVGSYSNITISVSDGTRVASLPAYTLTVSAPLAPPVISGTPPASVLAANPYSFTPTASDPNGYPLTFSVSNLPAWASFNTATGQISGTPAATQVGTYSNIVIAANDGKSTASLAAFSVTVNGAVLGAATLSWTPPTQNTDGTPLTDLVGYNIYYGTNSTALSSKVALTNPGLTAYTVSNLSTGTYYFAITAVDSVGAESAQSNVGSKTIQ